MRWFPSGSGYARDPRISSEQLTNLIDSTRAVRQERSPQFRVVCREGLIIGVCTPDSECLDPKAADRNPFVLKAALLNKDVDSKTETLVREKLKTLLLPLEPGPVRDTLSIRLPPPFRLPEPIIIDQPSIWERFGFSYSLRHAGLREVTQIEKESCEGHGIDWLKFLPELQPIKLPDGSQIISPCTKSAEHKSVAISGNTIIVTGRESIILKTGDTYESIFLRIYVKAGNSISLMHAEWHLLTQ